MAQPVPIKAYLHPAKAAAMFTAPRAEPTHLLPVLKPIFKMDCAN